MSGEHKFATNEEVLKALGLSNIDNIIKAEIILHPECLPTLKVTRYIDNVETLTQFTIRKS